MAKRQRQQEQDPERKRRNPDICAMASSRSPQLSQSSSMTQIRSPSRSSASSSVGLGSGMASFGLTSPVSTRETSQEIAIGNSTATASIRSPTVAVSAPTTSEGAFPTFATGDLKIHTSLVGRLKTWHLHSTVLARHSTWFARTIREQRATEETGAGYVCAVELINGRVQLSSKGAMKDYEAEAKSPGPVDPKAISIKTEDTEDLAHEMVVKIYDQIFGSFYNIPPRVTSTSIKRATVEAEELIKIARDLGCIHLISSHIGNALLQYRQTLYKAVFTDPPRYLLLALALENDFIYTESLIHLIGAYPYGKFSTSPKLLPDEMLRLIARKSRELDTEVLEVERELLLLTITSEPSKKPYRCDISSQFDTWFVVQMFRDALTTTLRQHDRSRPSLKRGSLFRKIKAGGSRYMAYEEVRRMVQRVMPSAVHTLEEDLKILKEYASDFVEDLAKNEASLDVEEHNVGWLTCAKIEMGDIPWRVGTERDV